MLARGGSRTKGGFVWFLKCERLGHVLNADRKELVERLGSVLGERGAN